MSLLKCLLGSPSCNNEGSLCCLRDTISCFCLRYSPDGEKKNPLKRWFTVADGV